MKKLSFLSVFFLLITIIACTSEPIDKNIDLNNLDGSCAVPTLFHASNFINTNSVALAWVPGGTETSWIVQYGPAGFTLGTGTLVTATSSLYTVTGLNYNNNYDFYVKSNCGSSSFSSWVGPVTVLAASNPNCQNPSNLVATRAAATPTDVDLTWVAGGTETSWQIEYGVSGFTLGSGTSMATTATNAHIVNLIITNGYDFYVRSNCSSAEKSNWIGPITAAPVQLAACANPSNIIAVRDTTDPTIADLNWAAGGTETAWEIQYGVKGFTLGAGTIISTTINAAQINGIPIVNDYSFYVRANCSAINNSNWVGPVTINKTVEPNAFATFVDNNQFAPSYISAGLGTSGYISVFGVKSSSEYVGILVDSSLDVGNYTITGSTTDVVQGLYRFNNINYNATDGIVVIDTKTTNRISGTFAFTASYSYTNTAGEVITVTHIISQGTFNISY
jgi:hypothetical protein